MKLVLSLRFLIVFFLALGLGLGPRPLFADPPEASNDFPAVVTPDQIREDVEAADQLMRQGAPEGFLTVFGGSRLKPGDPDYELARRFGLLWTQTKPQVPIATGGGPGNMEAANRGAREAGGNSLGFVMGGLKGETSNSFLTHQHTFKSFAYRESELIDRARAFVFTRGGIGTQWELFEVLAKIHTNQIAPRDVILLGDEQSWGPSLTLIHQLVAKGRVKAELLNHIHLAATPEDAVRLAKAQVEATPFRVSSLSPETVMRDTQKIREVAARAAPNGFTAIFGGSQVKAGEPGYVLTHQLAARLAAKKIAVATGGGPGVMEAANRGAKEHGGTSLGFAMGGLPGQDANPHITDGYVATAFAQRESEMIDQARAIVLADGGVGTQWELFEALTKIGTRQIAPKPILLLGPREQWRPVFDLLRRLVRIGTVSPDVTKWVRWVGTVDRAAEAIERHFARPPCGSFAYL